MSLACKGRDFLREIKFLSNFGDMKKRNQMQKRSDWKSDVRHGRGVSLNFFRNNLWIIILCLVLVLMLIGLRYRTKTRMMEIRQLTTELSRAESRKLEEKASYMSLIRESEMKRMVESRGLNLEFQQTPPYEISEKE